MPNLLLAVIVLLITSSKPSIAEDTATIAKHASAATVGVYARKGPDKFYGTGVIISPNGGILTSTTVVPTGSEEVEVYFSDHTKKNASIISIEEDTEAVFLKVEGENYPALPVADKLPVIGEPAYTLGNSGNMIKLGDGASFSAGIISGIYELKSADNQSGYHGLAIETDAAVNPGTDGGPLVNNRGQLMGIISRGFSALRWQGIAVPIEKILQSSNRQTRELITVSTKPLFTNPVPDYTQAIEKYQKALVGIEVKRRFEPEIISRPEWTEYRNEIKDWDTLPEKEQKRIMADFFAAESLLAANQMLRRPAGLVTGVLVSETGYILTSSFNVQSGDLVYLAKGQLSPTLPKYSGSVRRLYSMRSDEYEKTTNRVVSIEVILPDGRKVPAEIAGFDTALNIALLKVDVDMSLPFIDLDKLKAPAHTGENILLLGASADNRITVNGGIVSAARRNNDSMIQFDALLNYANAGGVLITTDGRLLGFAGIPLKPSPIMGKILPFKMPQNDPGARALSDFPNTPNSGIGLAVTAEKVREALPLLKAGAEIKNGNHLFTGFYPSKDSAFASSVIVGGISKDSPAQKSGLKNGDKIIAIDGVGIRNWKEIRDYIKEKKEGDTIIIDIFRPLGKPYLQAGKSKITSAGEFQSFLSQQADGDKITATVFHPGINQKIFLTLEKEK